MRKNDGATTNASSGTRRRALLRGGLGAAQMICATTALLLLIQTGINPRSLGAVVVTCVLTTLSVLLFGARRQT